MKFVHKSTREMQIWLGDNKFEFIGKCYAELEQFIQILLNLREFEMHQWDSTHNLLVEASIVRK